MPVGRTATKGREGLEGPCSRQIESQARMLGRVRGRGPKRGRWRWDGRRLRNEKPFDSCRNCAERARL